MKQALLYTALLAVASLAALIYFGSIAHNSDEQFEREYANATPWPPGGYATVKAYIYNFDDLKSGTMVPDPDILKGGRLVDSVLNKAGVELTPDQTRRLIAAISKVPPHHDGTYTVALASACFFDPHHAFVFYDSSGKPVAHIEVCQLCHDLAVSPTRKLPYDYNRDFTELDDLCRELKLPVFHNHEDYEAYRKTLPHPQGKTAP